jgi:hypothetical protein
VLCVKFTDFYVFRNQVRHLSFVDFKLATCANPAVLLRETAKLKGCAIAREGFFWICFEFPNPVSSMLKLRSLERTSTSDHAPMIAALLTR